MAILLVFDPKINLTRASDMLLTAKFQTSMGGGQDSYEGEEPNSVEMNLPSNVLFHPTFTPREATRSFVSLCHALGLEPGQYMAFDLAIPLNAQGKVTVCLH